MACTPMIVITTINTAIGAQDLAEQLLAAQLAACVHIAPIQALYRWAGEILQEESYQLTIKTQQACYAELVDWIHRQHPDEIPEILCYPIHTTQDYQSWLQEETTPDRAI